MLFVRIFSYNLFIFSLVSLVSLFNGISTFVGYLMPMPFSKNYFTNSWADKEVHTFPKGICPKVNVIARLEFELAYYDSANHRFNHEATPLFFSVFVLTFFQSSFLRACNVIFISVMIFYTNSRFILSCDNFSFVVLECVAFRLSVFCISIWLRDSCFSVFSISVWSGGDGLYSSLFTC